MVLEMNAKAPASQGHSDMSCLLMNDGNVGAGCVGAR